MASSYLEAEENKVFFRGEDKVHLRGAGDINFGRVSQEHCPFYFLSRGSILELEPHGQGDPQVNHRRREQEQPGEKSGSAAGLPSPPPLPPNSATLAPCLQHLGFCREKAKKLDAQISPQRSLMTGRPHRDETGLFVGSFLANLGLEAELTLDLAPPRPS